MKTQLAPEQKTAVSRIGGLILTNAMIFQEILADHYSDVLNLQKILGDRIASSGRDDSKNLAAEFANHWQFIMSRINYAPKWTATRSSSPLKRAYGKFSRRILSNALFR